jgi:hypothetical protein
LTELNYSALFESLAGRGFTAQEIATSIGFLELEGAAEAFEYLLERKAGCSAGRRNRPEPVERLHDELVLAIRRTRP